MARQLNAVVHQPESVDEVVALLTEYGDDAKLLAGGTAMMILIRSGLLVVPHVVSLARVHETRYVDEDAGAVRIGATTTLRELAMSPLLRERLPLLAGTVALVANHRVRAVATLGGTLAEADYASDPPPVLIGYGARVRLRSVRGERSVPVAELATSFYETCIAPDELLVEVEIPPQPPGLHAVYLKFTTRSVEDRPCVGVAAFVGGALGGSPMEMRVVVGAARATPFILDVETSDPEALGSACAEAITPISDLRGSAAYRRRVIRALVMRAVSSAAAGETAAVRV